MSISCSNTESLSRSDQVLLESVLAWYNEDSSRVDEFMGIVKRRNGMSLRVIDWLVTNYGKTTSVMLETDGIPRDLNRDYQKNLSAYNKRNMDPFARRNKISIKVFGKETRNSTVGQLNFFRWFIRNNIPSYLKKSKSVVEKHMKQSESRSKSGNHRRVKCTKHNTKSYSGKFTMEF